jgi:hypothetical protein
VEPAARHDAQLFPNPVSEDLNIFLNDRLAPDALLRLLDGDGREVLRQRLGNSTLRASVRGLAAGVYVCEVRNGEHITRRLVVVH